MLMAGLLAAAVWSRVPLAGVAIVGLAVLRPWWFLAACGGWAIYHQVRRRNAEHGNVEVAFLQAVAAELQAGASLRLALVEASARAPGLQLERVARLATAGASMETIAGELRDRLPVSGSLAAPALRLAADAGGRAAEVFGELAARALEADEIARERRVATAQARLSALVVGLAPLGFAVLMLLSGRGEALLDAGAAGLVVAVVGLSLQAAGMAVVWWMSWRTAW